MRPAPAFRDTDGRHGGGEPWRGPGGAGGGRGARRGSGAPEPVLRAPWPALALAGVLVAAWLAQAATGDPMLWADRFGFRPQALGSGGWPGLVTALFVHAGWTHALLNALSCLAFGAPVARRFGTDGAGAAAFLVFFVVCGVAGSLGFAAWPGAPGAVLVGASGGIAGLMGAASRMTPTHQGPLGGPLGDGRENALAPLRSRPVVAMAAAWLGVNLLFAVIGFDMGGGATPLAWQAHLLGYAAGVLGVAPALLLVRRRPAPRG